MTAPRTLVVWLATASVAGLAPAAALASVLDAQAAASYPWVQPPAWIETAPVVPANPADASYHWAQPPAWIETAPVVPANPADASYHWAQPPAWIPIAPAPPFVASNTYEWVQLR